MGSLLPFENDTRRLERRIVKRSLAANHRRNLLTGLIVFGAAFLLSFAAILAGNATAALALSEGVKNDRELVMALLGVALVVLLAAGLSIRGIIYLSVLQRTREFAQLRTLGATNRQIRRIVAAERRRMSRRWLGAGVLAGVLTNLVLSLPFFWGQSLFWAVLAAGFIWLVVAWSFRTPAKRAASVSPMAGLRQDTDGLQPNRHRSRRQSPLALGWRLLVSDRKKARLTLASLIFSGALLFVLFTVLAAVNIDTLARQPYRDDSCCYLLLNSTADEDSTYRLMHQAPFDEALRENIAAIPGVARITPLHMLDYEIPDAGLSGALEDLVDNTCAEHLVAGTLPEGGLAGETVPVVFNRASPYAVVDLDVGESITATVDNGEGLRRVRFEMTGVCEDKDDGVVFYTTPEAITALAEMDNTLAWYIVAEPGEEDTVSAAVRQLTAHDDRLSFSAFADDRANYAQYFATARLALGVLAALIAAFAFMNLLNTCITNSVVRQRDFALLEAVGMTRRQLLQALMVEHAVYFGGAFLGSWLIGGALGRLLCDWLSGYPGLGYIEYRFPLSFLLCYACFVAVVYLAVRGYERRALRRYSIVERLRAVE